MTIAVDMDVKPQTKQKEESLIANKNVFICKNNDCQKLIKHYHSLVIKNLALLSEFCLEICVKDCSLPAVYFVL